MKLSYKLVIAAFFVTIIGSFIWSANHYHNQAIEYKKQRDENAMALHSAMATISDMQKRQRDVAELDARYTKELADANTTLESLRTDVSAGRVSACNSPPPVQSQRPEPAAWAMEKVQDLQLMLNSINTASEVGSTR
ncbi:lysis system o-spanin lipoprotein Rz1 [Escherichia coli]|nr:lysis system o-spanin lipoprotein Rz1 [Escherichia coli]